MSVTSLTAHTVNVAPPVRPSRSALRKNPLLGRATLNPQIDPSTLLRQLEQLLYQCPAEIAELQERQKNTAEQMASSKERFRKEMTAFEKTRESGLESLNGKNKQTVSDEETLQHYKQETEAQKNSLAAKHVQHLLDLAKVNQEATSRLENYSRIFTELSSVLKINTAKTFATLGRDFNSRLDALSQITSTVTRSRKVLELFEGIDKADMEKLYAAITAGAGKPAAKSRTYCLLNIGNHIQQVKEFVERQLKTLSEKSV